MTGSTNHRRPLLSKKKYTSNFMKCFQMLLIKIMFSCHVRYQFVGIDVCANFVGRKCKAKESEILTVTYVLKHGSMHYGLSAKSWIFEVIWHLARQVENLGLSNRKSWIIKSKILDYRRKFWIFEVIGHLARQVENLGFSNRLTPSVIPNKNSL